MTTPLRERSDFSGNGDQVTVSACWPHPGQRSIATRPLGFHLERSLENGIAKDELIELIPYLAFYSGWPTSISAVMIAKDVFKQNPQRVFKLMTITTSASRRPQ